jgi:hypothetical protein
MPSTTMPPGGGVQAGGLWYTPQEWNASHPNGSSTASASSDQSGAKAIIDQTLAQYGLSGLADWAWNLYLQAGNADVVWNQLPQQQAFKDVYPAYDALAKAGKGITVSAYRQYIDSVNQLSAQYGVPAGFFDAKSIGNLLIGSKSVSELNSDLQAYATAAQSPAVTARLQSQLNEQGLGGHELTPGEWAAYFTDPTKALPAIQQRLLAAQIGAAGDQQGVGISNTFANTAAIDGVSVGQAQNAFNTLGQQGQLLTALPGSAEDNISSDTAASGALGLNAGDSATLANRAAGRKAQFQSGGTFSAGKSGYSGLGTATT